jgi:diguanylate cyclase (GGDEF)-like protein/PAS domain S-box-containing protein
MLRRWKHTLDAIPQMVWTMAGDGSDEYYNAQWAHFTGCDLGSGSAMRREDLIHPDDRVRVLKLWAEKFGAGQPYEARYRVKHVSGDFRWILSRGECERDPQGRPIRWYGTCTDIHDEVLGRQAANHDALTRLPNRALFQCALDEAIETARQGRSATAVLMMDLDDFKRTNDALGHDAGDALLVAFASRLRAAVRPNDMVARLGGDEFAVILNGVSAKEDIETIAASIFACLKPPCTFEGKLLDIRTSVGAASYPMHGKSRSELMKHADIALYAAKASGRGKLSIFQSSMRAMAQKRLSMLALARDALSGDRIVAHYQPKIDLRSGRLDGFEALLRWEHPNKGLQLPSTINAAFHDGALAAEISDRIMQCVVTDMRRWKKADVCFGHVAVNAGAAEFKDGKFAEKLLGRLRQADLAPTSLQLEVTETVFIGRGAEYVEQTLRLLSQSGIQIALDDFGTGYASLSHLNKFPVNVIKIDRSFIEKLETSEHDAAIVRAVIKLGRSLNIKIVAEGVETAHQARFLKKQRCDSGQGFLFGKAVAPDHIPALVKNWSRKSGEK